MLRLLCSAALLTVTLSVAAVPAHAKEYRLRDDQPCSLLTLLACDAGLYNIMQELKKAHPEKITLTQQAIDAEVKRLDEYILYARGNLMNRLTPTAVQSCRMDMLSALEAIDRKTGASLQESYDSCQQSAEAIGKRYDGQVNGQVNAQAMAAVPAAPTAPTAAPAIPQAASAPVAAKRATRPAPTAEEVATYEKKRLELRNNYKELERQMENEHAKLLEMDNAKAPQDRTKEDWDAMNAQAMKLLDAIDKQSDAMSAHSKHVFQDFETKYSRKALQ